MKVLEYADLDVSRVRAAYAKVVEALERDDFRSAEVKKLACAGQGSTSGPSGTAATPGRRCRSWPSASPPR